MEKMNGALVVDKPKGWTSHDVVARVRRLMQERSIGHLGTLDPMATGVLPLLIGRYTRLAQYFAEGEKEYEGVIQFGMSTSTYDADGEQLGAATSVTLEPHRIQALLEEMTGTLEQVPPPFSAKKVAGVPAYKLARRQEQVELRPVNVTVHRWKDIQTQGERLRFVVRVSPGTYVRSLAHDLGRKLGCGAYLAELRRTQSGEFTLDIAATLEKLEQLTSNDLAAALIPSKKLMSGMPNVTAVEDQAARMRNGNAANLQELSAAPLVKVFDTDGALIGIAKRVAGTLFQPKTVLG